MKYRIWLFIATIISIVVLMFVLSSNRTNIEKFDTIATTATSATTSSTTAAATLAPIVDLSLNSVVTNNAFIQNNNPITDVITGVAETGVDIIGNIPQSSLHLLYYLSSFTAGTYDTIKWYNAVKFGTNNFRNGSLTSFTIIGQAVPVKITYKTPLKSLNMKLYGPPSYEFGEISLDGAPLNTINVFSIAFYLNILSLTFTQGNPIIVFRMYAETPNRIEFSIAPGTDDSTVNINITLGVIVYTWSIVTSQLLMAGKTLYTITFDLTTLNFYIGNIALKATVVNYSSINLGNSPVEINPLTTLDAELYSFMFYDTPLTAIEVTQLNDYLLKEASGFSQILNTIANTAINSQAAYKAQLDAQVANNSTCSNDLSTCKSNLSNQPVVTKEPYAWRVYIDTGTVPVPFSQIQSTQQPISSQKAPITLNTSFLEQFSSPSLIPDIKSALNGTGTSTTKLNKPSKNPVNSFIKFLNKTIGVSTLSVNLDNSKIILNNSITVSSVINNKTTPDLVPDTLLLLENAIDATELAKDTIFIIISNDINNASLHTIPSTLRDGITKIDTNMRDIYMLYAKFARSIVDASTNADLSTMKPSAEFITNINSINNDIISFSDSFTSYINSSTTLESIDAINIINNVKVTLATLQSTIVKSTGLDVPKPVAVAVAVADVPKPVADVPTSNATPVPIDATPVPTTYVPTSYATQVPTTSNPTSNATQVPTTSSNPTQVPTTSNPTSYATQVPTTYVPTSNPTTVPAFTHYPMPELGKFSISPIVL